MTLRVIQGGRPGPAARCRTKNAATYCITVNRFGISHVWFQWSPTSNVFDCVMPLDEAVARGFVPVPRTRFDIVRAQVTR